MLVRLGLPIIVGYKPNENFQGALIEGVARYLGAANRPASLIAIDEAPAAANRELLIVDAPSPVDVTPLTRPLERLVRKFDPAARDARNRALGLRGEERAFHAERLRPEAAGRGHLARKVWWVAQEDSDGARYDIRSYAFDGAERLLEVYADAQTAAMLDSPERQVRVQASQKRTLFGSV